MSEHDLLLESADAHFNGERFFNPPCYRPDEHLSPKTAPERARNIFRWQMGLRPRWPDALPPTAMYPLPSPKPGECVTTFINHATVLLQFGRKERQPLRIITDPIFSERCSPFRNMGPKRVREPGLPLNALPPIDIILVSHCHYDHLDLPTLRHLAGRDDPLCISFPGNRRHLEKAGLPRIVELDWWESLNVDGACITATPALHGSARTPFDSNRALWGSFMIEADDHRVFFAGDTAWGKHFDVIRQRCGVPDLALIPIGAYAPRDLMRRVHMCPEEAVKTFEALGTNNAIGIHFNTFQLTDEGILEPAGRLKIAMHHHAGRFEVLDNGESRTLPPPRTSR
ncbi:MBL fold metallo-hydrolase [Gluconobacter wancherniae]|uniref:MBL fold metallo-hydrolase n=1 Tax=Gluconobacter wancherniae TaxID=1307955 RepID=UPI001B8C22A6|nr:MBL fold metallo-hydrolase [Gluconobacter wancherniae]MBS1087643.1 MBL fold metallo-hydrolase [Gluconobacter wancherniae]